MHFPARTAALLAALAALVATGLTATAAVPASASARSSVQPPAPALGDAYGDTVGDATMLAREAVLHHDTLPVSARKKASSLTTRPTYDAPVKRVCGTTAPICVHYVTSTDDASTDAAAAHVRDVIQRIYGIYKAAGYRMPESDGTAGGDSRVDIYLKDIGPEYYGYCAPEPRAGSRAHHMPAFCVLDNDYSHSQFPSGTPESNLDVTAAHEFFHAVQFAYDAYEDPWFMEGTAAWVEDYVYNSINDNRQYLRFGPLHKPGLSLDKDTTFGVYGDWIFFRWLTEHRPAKTGTLPTIIRSMWERAAANTGSDHYSLQAVKGAMEADGLPFRTTFAQFAAANRNPAHNYSEGAAYQRLVAAPNGSARLRPGHLNASGSVRINHLAAATERFTTKVKSKHAKLRISLDMANKKYNPGAVVTVFLRNGGTTVKSVKLTKRGVGAVTVPFSTKTVKRVELTMTNASTRMSCWINGLYSCAGTPKDQQQLEKYAVHVKR
jgi:hypothetical protein